MHSGEMRRNDEEKHKVFLDTDTYIYVYEDVYDPAEDTWLLLETISSEKTRNATIIDVCSGSGVIGIYIALRHRPRRVLMTDISYTAVINIVENIELHGLSSVADAVQCDLLSCIGDEAADVVTANPPYLPGPRRPGYEAYESGPRGYELPVRIVREARRVLRCRGTLYIVFSSRSGPEVIIDVIESAGFNIVKTLKKHFFFEDIIAVEAELIECRH